MLIDIKNESIEHLVDGLWTIFNGGVRVGIVGIELGVIEVCDSLDHGSFWQLFRPWSQFVAELPFEVVVGDLKEDFGVV